MADHEEEETPQETHKQTFWQKKDGHHHIHIHNFPKEVLQIAATGGFLGLFAAIFKGNNESQIIVDPKRLPPPGRAAKRLFTYPAFCATVFGSYVVVKEFANAVRGVHDRDWVTSFSGGFVAGGLMSTVVGRKPLWTTLVIATICGFTSAFFEGPFLEHTYTLQNIRMHRQNEEEPYARYKALTNKANDINNQHLADLERGAIQWLQDDKVNDE